MSPTTMASISSSFFSLSSSHDHERLDHESVRAFIVSVNQYMHEFLANDKTRKSLKLRCSLKLKIQKQEFFEFSEHSVLSNLYWGIESVEAAIQAKFPEEKASRLKNSEQMLQVPALLDEQGVTGGISNRYIVCCSYFYLSIVRKLQRDEWQVVLHFLQALMVSPRLVQTEFAPGLCENLFLMSSINENRYVDGSSFRSVSLRDSDEGKVGEAIRQKARRYKSWLMYYQVMQYGETTPEMHGTNKDTPSPVDQSPYNSMYGKSTSTTSSSSTECGNSLQTYCNFEKVHPLDLQESITDSMADKAKASSDNTEIQYYGKPLKILDQISGQDFKKSSNIKCLQDILMESQSDTPISDDSFDEEDSAEGCLEAYANDTPSSMEAARAKVDQRQLEISHQKFQNPSSISISFPPASWHPLHEEANINKLFSRRFSRSINDLRLSILELGDKKSHTSWNCHAQEETAWRRSESDDFQMFDCFAATSLQNYMFTQMDHQDSTSMKKQNSNSRKNLNEIFLHPEKDSHVELLKALDEAISKLCFSGGQGKYDEDSTVQVTTIYEMLTNKTGVKYTPLKDAILDQLLSSISTSRKEGVIRASVSILSTIILGNKSVIEDIKKKGLQLVHLASALKRNVYEAAILIYLINPSPVEIKTLGILPTLVDIVCTSNNYVGGPEAILTPPAASLMIIEALVTSFDCPTNSRHLAEISSPTVLSGFLDIARNNNLEELIPLVTILVKCMQFDGQCRKYISQFTPMAPFICLLRSNKKNVKLIALEFFHELLRMPRSSAISLLQQMKKEGSINIMHILLLCLQQSQSKHQLLAANLLLQLDQLQEDSSGRSIFKEEAMEVLLESVASEENSATQILSALILSNLGGTYSWTGEPYTVALLVKKAGLTSLHHRNLIRKIDWLDQSLQDTGTDTWCSKIGRSIIRSGIPVFHALEKGLKSKVRRVSQDCLTAIAWLGYEIETSPNELRCSACEILLNGIEQFLHPGRDLEERLLACLCIYNYASGKGMQKFIHFSEGVRESLGRLSSVTWMAEELLKIADYFLPYKSRISCVHTQILEMGHKGIGSVTALIYYKGQLCSGYLDGSIKVWDIKGQSATLVWDVKEHKKAVTCFSHFEPGGSLLSGSADKTIRVWQMVQKKLKCAEVISMKEPVQNLDTHGQMIFVVTRGHGVKVFDASRKVKDICKTKRVKCIRVVQGKIYIGCTDSSIQEVAITSTREQEIRAPAKCWRMQNKPITSIVMYKGWLYNASESVEGSNFKEWKRQSKPQMTIVPDKGASVLAMGVVEDFIYLNSSSSASILQIWLRGTRQKAGRLSAGSRITSLLTANDIVLCGTETGQIKGWIPL